MLDWRSGRWWTGQTTNASSSNVGSTNGDRLETPALNFFGHAVVASWLRPEVAYVLGSMLPDFASMIGARVPPIGDADVMAGTADHHVIDELFHELSTFRTLCRELGEKLIALGFDRGRARAVAHVGVEILLDRALADDPRASELYSAALDEAAPDALGQRLAWNAEEGLRFERLRTALKARRQATAVDESSTTLFRLARALEHRPRLALSPQQREKVAVWLVQAESAVSSGAAALVAELKSGLVARKLGPAPA
jgi:hypothetical protein